MIAALASLLCLAQAGVPADGGDAEALFREGLKAYDAKQYARAIESFDEAHKLSPLPEILFDIAMARRALGDCRRAADGFDAFIAAAPADDPLIERARARRAELGACASAAGDGDATPAVKVASTENAPPVASLAKPKSPATAAAPVLIAPAVPPAPVHRERAWLRSTCVASLGGTAVLGVGGLVFGWQALSAQRDVESATQWDDPAQRADERGRAFGQVATTLLISAGITAAVAATSCIATARSKTDR